MKKAIEERCVKEARYVIKTLNTVRQTAKVFEVSKSTVHKDISERIWEIDVGLALAVADVLEYNLSERHMRGGNATKARWEVIKSKK